MNNRLNLGVLDLCDRALDASLAISREEAALKDTFLDAKAELNDVLQGIAKAAGGIRGHDLCEHRESYTTHHHIPVIPGTAGGKDDQRPYIDRESGEIFNCKEPRHLIYVWRALPGILSQHIAACQDDSDRNAQTTKEMTAIWHGSQALRSFAKAAMPPDWKRSLMERALGDADLQDALKAAAATGEDGAPLKVLREQIDPEDEEGEEGEEGEEQEAADG